MYAADSLMHIFLSMIKTKKGKIICSDGQTNAYIDEYAPVTLEGEFFQATIRNGIYEVLAVAINAHHAKHIEIHLELCTAIGQNKMVMK